MTSNDNRLSLIEAKLQGANYVLAAVLEGVGEKFYDKEGRLAGSKDLLGVAAYRAAHRAYGELLHGAGAKSPEEPPTLDEILDTVAPFSFGPKPHPDYPKPVDLWDFTPKEGRKYLVSKDGGAEVLAEWDSMIDAWLLPDGEFLNDQWTPTHARPVSEGDAQ